MEIQNFADLAGETGSASITGGCVAPVSLKLTFRFEREAVILAVANERYFAPPQAVTGERRISLGRYQRFAQAVRDVLEGPSAEPTWSTGQLGVGVSLPMPGGRLVGGGHEMEEGPDPLALEKLIGDLVYEAWNIEPPAVAKTEPIPQAPHEGPASDSPKDTRTFDMIRRYAPFLMPLTVFALAAYFTLRAGSSEVGEDCDVSGDCAGDAVCNTTDTGWFWIFGMEGYCTRRCDPSHPCPGNMECRQTAIKVGVGTKWAFHYRRFEDTYCVPPD